MPAVRRTHPTRKALAPPANVRRVLSIDTVAQALDRTVASIYRYIKEEPNFPQPLRIGAHRIGFYEDELAAWIAQLPRASERPTGDNISKVKRRKVA